MLNKLILAALAIALPSSSIAIKLDPETAQAVICQWHSEGGTQTLPYSLLTSELTTPDGNDAALTDIVNNRLELAFECRRQQIEANQSNDLWAAEQARRADARAAADRAEWESKQ